MVVGKTRKKNVIRDAKAINALGVLGYKVIIVWECETKNTNLESLMEKLPRKLTEGKINSGNKT
jgi:DNA mismatch endonuclease, patch repair protein